MLVSTLARTLPIAGVGSLRDITHTYTVYLAEFAGEPLSHTARIGLIQNVSRSRNLGCYGHSGSRVRTFLMTGFLPVQMIGDVEFFD